MNLASAFTLSCETNRAKTALFWGETELSYEALFQQSLQVGSFLGRATESASGERLDYGSEPP